MGYSWLQEWKMAWHRTFQGTHCQVTNGRAGKSLLFKVPHVCNSSITTCLGFLAGTDGVAPILPPDGAVRFPDESTKKCCKIGTHR